MYAAVQGHTLIVLHVFVRKTQTTPRAAIEIARLESGRRPPSLRTVRRYAQAVGARAVVRLEA